MSDDLAQLMKAREALIRKRRTRTARAIKSKKRHILVDTQGLSMHAIGHTGRYSGS
jgi:hypothetical protein